MSKLKAAATLACLVTTVAFAGVTYQTVKTSVAVESTSQSAVGSVSADERVQVTTTDVGSTTTLETLSVSASEKDSGDKAFASTTKKSTSAAVKKTTKVVKRTTTETTTTTTTTTTSAAETAPAETEAYVEETAAIQETVQETEAPVQEVYEVVPDEREVMAPEDDEEDEPAETEAPAKETAAETTTTTAAPETTTTTTTTTAAAKSKAITVSQSEYYMLCNVVAHEYGSNWVSTYDKALVVEVVMNRVNSGLYPNTIKGVLTQPYQFSGASSYVYLNGFSYQVTQSCKDAVDLYLSDPSQFNHGYTSFYGDGYRNYFR